MQQAARPSSLLRPVRTHDTDWEPDGVKVTLNVASDGCIVPSTAGGARVDYSHLVVLDGFLDEATRTALLDALTAPGWQGPHPPGSSWERATADAAQRPATWGLKAERLTELAAGDLPAKLEVQSRLCKLYPDMHICHMPTDAIQLGLQPPAGECQHPQQADVLHGQHQHQQHQQQRQVMQETDDMNQQSLEGPQLEGQLKQQDQQRQQQQQQQHREPPPTQQPMPPQQQQQEQKQQQQQRPAVDCSWLLANAAVAGDVFSWHLDADPQSFPHPSPWTQMYGLYCNREAGKPLFVSLLLYLDKEWPRENDAETLFLDSMSDTGVFVRPKAYRAVLMDQDVVHRLSTPSAAAGRPRYSLVWKLVFVPKAAPSTQQHGAAIAPGSTIVAAGTPPAVACIAREEWGPPTYFGSAAHVMKVAKAVATAGTLEQRDGSADAQQPAAKQQHLLH